MIRSTGITRKIDELGRIVLPSELRKKLELNDKDAVEFFIDGSSVILRKFTSNCIFCGSNKNLLSYNNKLICDKCKNNITNLDETSTDNT